jgi:hypothetical protein
MISTAEVILWGTRIGIIHLEENKPYLAFEYDGDFLDSGIELSPFHMPLSSRVYEFPELVGDAFHGAPGLIADSLPDKFGNKVIERWLAEQGLPVTEFRTIDRLCYAGKTMGISKQRCSRIIAEVEAVAENFSEYFEQADVSEQTCEMLQKIVQEQ